MTPPLHREYERWAILWRRSNRLDGYEEFIIGDGEGMPLTFSTRQETRDHIKQRYGYIRERKDLREEPHGWKMPTAVKVTLHLYCTYEGNKP